MTSQAMPLQASKVVNEHAAAGAGETAQFVTFTLGAQHYCVDITSVREIRAWSAITPLPGTDDFIRGVINLRGAVVPIIDLRTRFGQGKTEATPDHVIVTVMIDGRITGLLVDAVSDILTLPRTAIEPVPATDGEPKSRFFDGLITQQDNMLIVIALDRLTKRSDAASARPSSPNELAPGEPRYAAPAS